MNTPRAATASGTAQYRERFANDLATAHFREAHNLWLSSIGLGTYLGQPDERTDAAYQAAVQRALQLGCNVIDTAANYRFQRSERNIGQALATVFATGHVQREEVVITTKGGFIPFDTIAPRNREDFRTYLEATFINPGICDWDDFVQGQHCMTPAYLAHQLAQSLRNLQLAAVDVYYLHNPESQLAEVSQEEFYQRLRLAFEFLETAVADGKISMYGTATWNAYRVPAQSSEWLSLERVVQTAQEVAGPHHHFKVVQLPVNLAMLEAFTHANQPVAGEHVTFLEAAAALGITVMTSGSILQSKLATGLPAIVADIFPGLETDAQRAIQFVRSTPGVTTALVGMSNIQHVEENLRVAKLSPVLASEYVKLFERH